MPFFIYFTDPVLRAPTIGCMLMCLAAALVGVIAFLRKQSLLGESLSHAAYPGVMVGVIAVGALFDDGSSRMLIASTIMSGAFLSALIGVWCIQFLERSVNIRNDSALCFVLSVFFGVGITLASRVQFAYSALYKKSLTYLYGQAATMTDVHIFIYGTLSLLIILLVVLLYKELQALTFDRDYAKSIGIQTNWIDTIVYTLLVLAVVVGIRSVGVVLMSAMLIAPAVAARQFTNKLYKMLSLAALFGLISGFLGNVLSVEITKVLAVKYPTARLALPTGPMIVMVASSICLFSLLFAPERGLLIRFFRIARFRYRCICENVLKTIWRIYSKGDVKLNDIVKYQAVSKIYLRFILYKLSKNGWVRKTGRDTYRLTSDGEHRGGHIVRLHRLWEVYLADYLGVGAERVHHSAEEMEHIITPEIEQELIVLLKDPKEDPHHQPIPPGE